MSARALHALATHRAASPARRGGRARSARPTSPTSSAAWPRLASTPMTGRRDCAQSRSGPPTARAAAPSPCATASTAATARGRRGPRRCDGARGGRTITSRAARSSTSRHASMPLPQGAQVRCHGTRHEVCSLDPLRFVRHLAVLHALWPSSVHGEGGDGAEEHGAQLQGVPASPPASRPRPTATRGRRGCGDSALPSASRHGVRVGAEGVDAGAGNGACEAEARRGGRAGLRRALRLVATATARLGARPTLILCGQRLASNVGADGRQPLPRPLAQRNVAARAESARAARGDSCRRRLRGGGARHALCQAPASLDAHRRSCAAPPHVHGRPTR